MMTAKGGPLFDIDGLRATVGEAVFARGEDYVRAGRVRIVSVGGRRVVGQVFGSEDYRTELTGGAQHLEGACSCPAFADYGYCKHIVALALTANSAVEQPGGHPATQLSERLRRMEAGALADLIVGLAERDPKLRDRLEMLAPDTDDAGTRATFRRVIDRATRVGEFVEYRRVRAWTSEVKSVLDDVATLVSTGRAQIAFDLASHALSRIATAIESIDDSDGDGGALLHKAREIQFAAVRVARPEPLGFARLLFAGDVADGGMLFDEFALDYADVLGETGLAEYRRLATVEWESLQRGKGRRGRGDVELSYYFLRLVLDFFAERDGDVDARIALLAHDLSSPVAYLRLAQFCLEQGRPDEALSRAEEAMWTFEDDEPHEGLVIFTADLLLTVQREGEAKQHLWRAFEHRPSVNLYQRLLTTDANSATTRAIALIEGGLRGGRGMEWPFAADLLVSILLAAGRIDEAWAAVRTYKVSDAGRREVAAISEATHPMEVAALWTQDIDLAVQRGGNENYANAIKLIRRLAALRDRREHRAHLMALRDRFERKRNFVKLIDAELKAG